MSRLEGAMQNSKSPNDNNAHDLSVVLPVYNEHDTVRQVIMQLIQVLEKAGLVFEIIAVNDYSTDGTRETIENLHSEFPSLVRIINHPYNKGNGAAVKTGIRMARGRIIACLDADGQHNPGDIVQMLPFMDDYDLVVGARTETCEGDWHRNFANRFYNALASCLTGFAIKDLTSGYRLFRASIIKKVTPLLPARFSYPTTSTLIFLKGGYNLKYVPIRVNPRRAGTSKIRIIRDGWRFFTIIFKIVLIYEPLRLFLPVAGLSFLIALVSAGYSTWDLHRLRIPNSSVILFVVSVLVFLLGFISEQITAVQLLLKDDTEKDN
jgi:glycosyltransferase involved in cell wall biosynthesis